MPTFFLPVLTGPCPHCGHTKPDQEPRLHDGGALCGVACNTVPEFDSRGYITAWEERGKYKLPPNSRPARRLTKARPARLWL